jgi:hypothetical protein
MDETFILLPAHWTVERAGRFLDGQECTHIVIRREEPGKVYHYLYPRKDAQAVLDRVQPQTTLFVAFDLHEYTSTDERDAHSSAEAVPDRAVVLEEGRVVGFFDAKWPPQSPASDEARWTPPRVVISHEVDYDSHEVDYEMDAGDGGAHAPAPAFEAYPALSTPDAVPPATAFDIFVGFRDEPDPRLTDGGLIRVENPDPSKDCLVVLVADGLTLDRDHDYLPLRKNAQVRFSGTFKPGVTEASVKVLFFYEGQLIGTARRGVAAAPSGVAVAAAPATAPRSNPCRMTTPAPESSVDITVSLTHMQDGTLEWRLAAPAVSADITRQRLRTSLPESKQFAADLLRDLKTQGHRGVTARNILETTGQDVAALLPPEFFDLLRDVHARIRRAPTLLLLTNEVFVPWELAYLEQPLDPAAPPFLAAQTHMGRWLEDMNVMLPPAVTLDVKRITAVASQYGLGSGQRELKEAIDERQTLSTKWRAVQLEAVKADMEAMVSGTKIPGHLVHFAVHGYSDPNVNNQVLLLADGTQLPASALTGAYSCGQTPRFSFVFLNACQVGSPGRSLGHAGGFPGILVRRGALGFIAPLWDVHDDLARALAEAFYAETLDSKQPVGAVLHARRRAYQHDSTTPMAYIYYGHPALRLNFAPN